MYLPDLFGGDVSRTEPMGIGGQRTSLGQRVCFELPSFHRSDSIHDLARFMNLNPTTISQKISSAMSSSKSDQKEDQFTVRAICHSSRPPPDLHASFPPLRIPLLSPPLLI